MTERSGDGLVLGSEGRLRVVFFGSSEFSVPIMSALALEHEIGAVICQPDRRRGRGRKLMPARIKMLAAERNISPVFQPRRLRDPAFIDSVMSIGADIFVVASYGKILPLALLEIPPLGSLNIHPSLLPRYRGPAPISWTILNGDCFSGITIIKIDRGIDTGPVLICKKVAVGNNETAGQLSTRLSEIGAEALKEILPRVARDEIEPRTQCELGASGARKLTKQDGAVDWSWSAIKIDRWIRGMDPWPGAYCRLEDQRLRLFGSSLEKGWRRDIPGTVLDIDREGLIVAAEEGAIRIAEGQLPGRKRTEMSSLARGSSLGPGSRLRGWS